MTFTVLHTLFFFFKETAVSKKVQEENTHIKEEKLVSC